MAKFKKIKELLTRKNRLHFQFSSTSNRFKVIHTPEYTIKNNIGINVNL